MLPTASRSSTTTPRSLKDFPDPRRRHALRHRRGLPRASWPSTSTSADLGGWRITPASSAGEAQAAADVALTTDQRLLPGRRRTTRSSASSSSAASRPGTRTARNEEHPPQPDPRRRDLPDPVQVRQDRRLQAPARTTRWCRSSRSSRRRPSRARRRRSRSSTSRSRSSRSCWCATSATSGSCRRSLRDLLLAVRRVRPAAALPGQDAADRTSPRPRPKPSGSGGLTRWASTCRSSRCWSWPSCSARSAGWRSKLLGPRNPTVAKSAPYECGIVPDREPPRALPGALLPGGDDLHRLRHRDHLPVPLGHRLPRARRRSGWSRSSSSRPRCSSRSST